MLTDTAITQAQTTRDPAAGLRGVPLLFLFVETSDINRQRAFLEGVLGLPVIENQFHPPHHRHGLFKYDAGSLIVGLNLSAERRFLPDESDAAVAVYRTPWAGPDLAERFRVYGFAPSDDGAAFTDADGHHYRFRHEPGGGPAALEEVRLSATDLSRARDFYGSTLGLELLARGERSLRFATGTVDLVLELGESAPDGRAPRRDTYLPVFHAPDVRASFDGLRRRGLAFKAERPGFSQIGGTARFADPSGHTFCIYEPSAESLTWGSGPKVRALAAAHADPS